jgi:hypothetical protein
MSFRSDRLPVSVTPRPFTSADPVVVQVAAGSTVRAALAEIVRAGALPADDLIRLLPATRVLVDGRTLPRETALDHVLTVDQVVAVDVCGAGGGGGGEKDVGQLLLTVAVLAVSAWVGGAPGIGLGLKSAFLRTVASATVMALGQAAVAALFAPEQQGQSRAADRFALQGASNQYRPWAPFPLALGEVVVAPDFAVKTFSRTDGDDVWLQGILGLHYGPCAVSELKIGDTLVSSMGAGDIQIVEHLTPGPRTFALYPNDVDQLDLQEEMEAEVGSATPVVRAASSEGERFEFDFFLPGGLHFQKDDGRRISASVTLSVRSRPIDSDGVPTGDGSWSAATSWTLSSTTREPWRVTRSLTLPLGRYEFEVVRSAKVDANEKRRDQVALTAIRAVAFRKPIVDETLSVIEFSVRATALNQGTLAPITCRLVPLCPTWDAVEGEWTSAQATSNPAALTRWLTTGPAPARPLALGEADQRLRTWSELCDAYDWRAGLYLTEVRSQAEVLALLESAGRASLFWDGGQLAAAPWVEKPAPRQLFAGENLRNHRWQILYPDPVHALRVEFQSLDQAGAADELYVYADGYAETDGEDVQAATLIEALRLEGQKTAERAYRDGRWALGQRKLQRRIDSWETDVEYLASSYGDRVRLSWGRVEDANGVRIRCRRWSDGSVVGLRLAQPVRFEPGLSYAIDLRRADGLDLAVAVVNPASTGTVETREIAFVAARTEAQTPRAGDLVAFGRAALVSEDVELIAIEPGEGLTAALTAMRYVAPELMAGETGPIPDLETRLSRARMASPPTPRLLGVQGDPQGVRVTFALPPWTGSPIAGFGARWRPTPGAGQATGWAPLPTLDPSARLLITPPLRVLASAPDDVEGETRIDVEIRAFTEAGQSSAEPLLVSGVLVRLTPFTPLGLTVTPAVREAPDGSSHGVLVVALDALAATEGTDVLLEVRRNPVGGSPDAWEAAGLALDSRNPTGDVLGLRGGERYGFRAGLRTGEGWVSDWTTEVLGTVPAGATVATDTTHVDGVAAATIVARVVSVEDLAAQNAAAVEDLETVYGDTVSSATNAAAAATSAAAAIQAEADAIIAQGAAQTAAADAAQDALAAASSANAAAAGEAAAEAARAAAVVAQGQAETQAAAALTQATAAASSAANALTSRNDAQTFSNNAASSASTAEGHAATASTQAGLAAGSASDAGGSATAAAGSASSAATSATNASNSATAASASSVSAASSLATAIQITRNPDFNQGSDGWFDYGLTTAVTTSGAWSNVLRTPAGVSSVIFGEHVPLPPGDFRFRLKVKFRQLSGAAGVYYAGLFFYDAAGDGVTATDGTGNYPLASAVSVSAGQIIDRECVVGRGGTVPASPYGSTTTIPAGAVTFRLGWIFNYNDGSGASADAVGEIDHFSATDVTSEMAAANSAAASATSASSAATSATEAGTFASSASTQATNAATSAANASTSATQASNAATTAEGHAATASTQAGVATSAAGTAGGHASSAATSASNAASSATSAGTSSSAAATSATQAATSAGQASTSASQASSSADTAAGHASSAATSATNAANSSSAAGGSASAAAGSASNAATSATNAGNSAAAAAASSVTARSDAANTFPYDFADDYRYFSPSITASPAAAALSSTPSGWQFITDSGARLLRTVALTPVYMHVRPLSVRAAVPGRSYRQKVRARNASGHAGTLIQAAFYGLTADYSTLIYLNDTDHLEVLTTEGGSGYLGTSTAFQNLDSIIKLKASLPSDLAWIVVAPYAFPTTGNPLFVDWQSITFEDVTESRAALASANAAATSASSAATSNTAAGQSASAAATSATNAATSAGQASTSATSASNSAQTAEGHAATASTQASLAAASAGQASGSATAAAGSASTAATHATNAGNSASAAAASSVSAASSFENAVRLTRNPDFEFGKEFWDTYWSNAGWTYYASSYQDLRANILRSPYGESASLTSELIPIAPGSPRYRLKLSTRLIDGSTSVYYYAGLLFYDAAGTLLTANDGTGNYPLGAASAHGNYDWQTREIIVGPGMTNTYPYGGTQSFPANTAFVRLYYIANYGAAAAGLVEVDHFSMEDVTSEVASAASATAAATQASNAATSATAAGSSASAAATSATNAATSAGQASTSASQASTSADTASGHAASAGTSATAAANSASAAAGSSSAAAGSASNAATSATAAGNSATAAAASSVSAASSFDATRMAAASLLPSDFSQEWLTFFPGYTGKPGDVVGTTATNVTFPTVSGAGKVMQVAVIGGDRDIAPVGAIRLEPDKTLRISARIRASIWASGPVVNVWRIALNDQHAYTGPGSDNINWTPSGVDGAGPASLWSTITYDVTTNSLLADGQVYLRPMLRFTAGGSSGNVYQVQFLRVDDITGQTAAAASATAAATQASNASTSATAAGASATAAAASATSASTSAGSASTFASQASTSAAEAQTASTSAGTQASNAAASAATATTQASSAAASAASASASSTLAATLANRSLLQNSSFTAFTGTGYPPGWSNWSNGSGTAVTGEAGGSAYQQVGGAGSQTGILQFSADNTAKPGDYFVMEARVRLDAGTLVGAGVLDAQSNSAASAIIYQQAPIIFSTWPDVNGNVIGNGVVGQTYSFSRLMQFNHAPVKRALVYAMTHYDGFGSTSSANQLTWFLCSIRPATPAEIAAGIALPALQASVSTNTAAIVDLEGQLQSAFFEVIAAAGGNPAQLLVRADAAGSLIALVANQLILKNVVGDQILTALKLIDGKAYFGAPVSVDVGSKRLTLGPGFGVDNEVLLWFGPSTTAQASMTRANADFALGSDGNIYKAAGARLTIAAADIPDLTVDTIKIKNAAVTNEANAFTASKTSLTGTTWKTLQSVALTTTGQRVIVNSNFFMELSHEAAGVFTTTIRIKRGAGSGFITVYETNLEGLRGDFLTGWQAITFSDTPSADTWSYVVEVKSDVNNFVEQYAHSRFLQLTEFKR